jgi:hypothetical protein
LRMSTVTQDQANMMLRVYEMRREPRLRQARAWFVAKFSAATPEELAKKYPQGTEENASFRMLIGYWEMVCGILNRGLMDDELFFENNNELWIVWFKIRPLVLAMRHSSKNPRLFAQLEAAATRLEAWWDRVAPGYLDHHRNRIAQLIAQAAQPPQPNS